LEGENKELGISALSLPGGVQNIFGNTKSSHIRLSLGNDFRHTRRLADSAHAILACIESFSQLNATGNPAGSSPEPISPGGAEALCEAFCWGMCREIY
jgi:hypothetical protein